MILFNILIFKKIIKTIIYIVIMKMTTCIIIEIAIHIDNIIDLIFINIEIIIMTKSINTMIMQRF